MYEWKFRLLTEEEKRRKSRKWWMTGGKNRIFATLLQKLLS
jgi:hypothetical protein